MAKREFRSSVMRESLLVFRMNRPSYFGIEHCPVNGVTRLSRVSLIRAEILLQRSLVSQCVSDDHRCLRGRILQRAIIKVGVDRGGLSLTVPEQLADGGEPDTIHYGL